MAIKFRNVRIGNLVADEMEVNSLSEVSEIYKTEKVTEKIAEKVVKKRGSRRYLVHAYTSKNGTKVRAHFRKLSNKKMSEGIKSYWNKMTPTQRIKEANKRFGRS
jgi:hypothetical protein